MQYNRKMINGVVFLEEQADYLLLLGKEGLYTVQAENDHWNVHYTLPGDTSNLDKQFISKDEALGVCAEICEAQNPKRNAARIARRRSIHPSYGYLV